MLFPRDWTYRSVFLKCNCRINKYKSNNAKITVPALSLYTFLSKILSRFKHNNKVSKVKLSCKLLLGSEQCTEEFSSVLFALLSFSLSLLLVHPLYHLMLLVLLLPRSILLSLYVRQWAQKRYSCRNVHIDLASVTRFVVNIINTWASWQKWKGEFFFFNFNADWKVPDTCI